ncbi:multidrug efflux protein [Siculibacillus lacustris]|uniref:Multidrug efflux protein n=1 Tax=Siculibacillus lacustris TaxID=1549641 RepID=A0A4Q9VWD9_9HYPH|nr:efflux RND transporter permease subunit [Siculibacillus lacustris]TBW40635.1 multidrug efflux protein [Siculibacillus lacustris]
MTFTDIFIRRPVLAMVISMLILVVGLRAVFSLPVLQYPRTQNAVVTVSTTYPGADPDVVAGFITTPLEGAIAQANGIDYMSSTSASSSSTITVNLRLNWDSGKALTEINAKVNSVLNQLPSGAEQPILTLKVGQTVDAMYIGFRSDALEPNQITDYLVRVVQPKLQSLEGVQTAEILGAKKFALRAWLDPQKLAAYQLTATDISTALANNDYIAGVGATKGQMIQVNLTASTALHSVAEFRDLVVKQAGGAVVRLSDVAEVSLGADDYDTSMVFGGKRSIAIGIQVAPTANLLDVIGRVRTAFPAIHDQLPEGLEGLILYDSTEFVNSSIDEVIHTLVEALAIVTVVVFLFLGSWRSVLIPVIAIPLSLVGTFTMMLIFGFSINLLTLLALVLAIGLVVDDAIIVVENVERHLAEGLRPFDAAIRAARELAGPIIVMTVVLVAVYVPLGFQGGLTGALFIEFAFTLVGAVTVSAIVALTLTPMMAAHFLVPHARLGRFDRRVVDAIDVVMSAVTGRYKRLLTGGLNYLPVTAVFAALVLTSIGFLYVGSKSELAPDEDQGFILGIGTPSANATLQQRQLYNKGISDKLLAMPETETVFEINLPTQTIFGHVLKPWNQRAATVATIQPRDQAVFDGSAGLKVVGFSPPPLPGSTGLPLQLVIGTTNDFEQLGEVSDLFQRRALETGRFIFLDNDLKLDKKQSTVVIDRDKTAQLGLKLSDVGGALGALVGGGHVNWFSLAGRSYKVIPQIMQQFRLTADQILDTYVRAADGSMVPLRTVATIVDKTVPESLNHFQQINSATIGGVAFPGVTTGEALATLQEIAKEVLPQGYTIDYGGASRQFVQESSGMVTTFLFAILIIFLTLAAQFESFRDPIVILVSVPMSIAGALIFIFIGIGGASLNIYTQVGLITLIGLVSKHGILMVEFANEAQEKGLSKHDAIIEAATVRFRPILMTTAAMVLGVVPLILASGAGAMSRFAMGLVIATGMSIGTLFTLLVVPGFYMMIAVDRSKVRPAALEANAEPAH